MAARENLPVEPPPPAIRPGPDFVTLWRTRRWLLIAGLVIGLGLGYLYYSRSPAVYESSCLVMVERREANLPVDPNAMRGEGNSVDSLVSTHMILLRSPRVMEPAAEKLAKLPALAGRTREQIIGRIATGLSVARSRPMGEATSITNVLQISCRGDDPQETMEIVAAVVAAYQEYVGDSIRHLGREMVEYISKAKDELNTSIKKRELDHRQFREKSPLVLRATDGTGQTIHERNVIEIEKGRSTILLSRPQLEARIHTIETALAKNTDREAILLLIGKQLEGAQIHAQAATTGFLTEEDRMLPLQLEEKLLLQKYGVEHPRILALRTQMQMVRDHSKKTEQLARQRDEARDKSFASMLNRPTDFINAYVGSMKQELRDLDERTTRFNELAKSERELARQQSNVAVTDDQYRSEIGRLTLLFDAIVKRLEEINLLNKNDGWLRVEPIARPGLGYQVAPVLSRILIIAAILGLAGGLGLAYLAELADKSFRSPEEIRAELGVPVIAHIPVIANASRASKKKLAGELHPALCCVHAPKGRNSEAFRSVRTALYFSTQGEGHKLIQITSPEPGDGKTTLASNLAVAIAQSGKRVLLVDADFRRPRVHRLFGVANDVGIVNVMTDAVALDAAIQRVPQIDNLSVLPCGPRPPNPAELLTATRFKDLLDRLTLEYDFVLVDTPPLLAVTDPSTVAPRVDGVVLALRLGRNTRPQARRAIEVLHNLGVKVLGVVVNGVGSNTPGYGGSGYYSYGRYQYAGRYGYASGYGYEDYLAYPEYYGGDDGAANRLPIPVAPVHVNSANGAAAKPKNHDMT